MYMCGKRSPISRKARIRKNMVKDKGVMKRQVDLENLRGVQGKYVDGVVESLWKRLLSKMVFHSSRPLIA